MTPTEKRKEKSWRHYFKIGITAFLTVAACITFFFVLYRIDDVFVVWDKIITSARPVIIGLVLAYLLMPVESFIEKHLRKFLISKKVEETVAQNLARTIGIAGAIVALFLILSGLIAILVPALVTSVVGLVEAMPGYVESFVEWIQEFGFADVTMAGLIGQAINGVTEAFIDWSENELIPLAQEYIAQITSGVFSVLKVFLDFLIGIIVMVYVMSIRDTLTGQCKKIIYAFFPSKKGNIIIDTVRKSNQIFGGFIIGKIIDSAIIGVIAYVGCMIMNTPSAILVAFIVGVTNIIPFFGPFIGAIPSILLVLIQSPIHAVYLGIFILILQQVDGNIIGPKILGDTTGLSSFWVLFSILVAGGIFGFFGMLLGVPVFAVIYYIVQQLLDHRMKKKELPIDTEEYINLEYIDGKNQIVKFEIEENKEEKEKE